MRRGLIVAGLHLTIVLALTAKYAWDRERLPRAWARTINYDPNLPVRGRYVSLAIDIGPVPYGARVILSAHDETLVATETKHGGLQTNRHGWIGPVAFFLPEHVKDPTQLQPGEALWVEVSVPPSGMPRPLHLGIRKNGVITPLELR